MSLSLSLFLIGAFALFGLTLGVEVAGADLQRALVDEL